jgi:general secretion pathway protein K
VLVTTLILTALLVGMLGSVAATQHLALKEVQAGLQERRAEAAARSALAHAMAVLVDVDVNRVTLQDDWAQLGGEDGAEEFALGDDATYRVQIVDASGLVDVNTASEEQLQQLPLTPEEIESLLDWREEGTLARTNGAKDDYYNQLSTPYNAALRPLETLSELLLIQDWTAAMLYVPQTEPVSAAELPEDAQGNVLPLASLLTVEAGMPDTRADGSARVNVNQQPSPALWAQLGITGPLANLLTTGGPAASFAQLLTRPGVTTQVARQLLDGANFTAQPVRLAGRLNVNTAPEAALRTLPNLTPDIAAAIVQRQEAGFQSLGELVDVPGLTPQALAQVADALGVGSDTFLVRAWGESGGIGVALEATVRIEDDQPRILGVERLNEVRVPGWWVWVDESEITEASQ